MRKSKRFSAKHPILNSFQMILLIRLSIVILGVILLMTFVLNSMFSQRMKENQIALQKLKAESTLANLDYYYMNLMAKTDLLFFNQTLSDLLEMPSESLAIKVFVSKAIGTLADPMFFNLKYPEVKTSYYFGGQVNVCIYTKNKDIYQDEETIFDYYTIENETFVTELLNERRTFSWNYGSSPKTGRYLALNRRILSTKDLSDIALLQLRIPLSKIDAILEQDLRDNVDYYAYIDANNNIFTSNGPSVVFENIMERDQYGTAMDLKELGGSYLVDIINSSLNGYRLITATSMAPIYKSISFVKPLIFGTGSIAIILCGILFLFTSSTVMRGIRQLIRRTRQVSLAGHGGYATLGPIQASNEIMELDEAFRKMVSTIESLYQREAQYQKNIAEVQAELLQEQFNPHLLYNTLSMIRYMVKDQKSIYDVTDNLISFYKHVLNRGQLMTTIQDEVYMIENYLRVVQQVYHIDLSVEMDISDEILPYYSVKMFLQPIVENAILHGLRQIGGGSLHITGTMLEDKQLCFVISDDGVGIEPNIKDKICSILHGNSSTEGMESYGCVSVSKRLRLFFGDHYKMELQSEPGEGTTVTVRIPALKENEISDHLMCTFI